MGFSATDTRTWSEAGAIVLAALALVLPAIGVWRGRLGGGPGVRPLVRIFVTAAMMTGALAIMMAVAGLLEREPETPQMVIATILVFGLLALLLMLVVEGLARLSGPRRSWRWLLAAGAFFLFLFTMVPGLALWGLMGPEASELLRWQMLEYHAVVAGGAIVWWSYLPPMPPGVSPIFE